EQGKQSFATYAIAGLKNVAPNGIPISFADGHIRSFPRLTGGPFRYRTPADVYLERAQRYAHVPVKQAIISPSALSLLYPQGGIDGYSRQDYLDDLLDEQESEIRRCLQKGAHVVQIDFTEGRLAVKLDPTRRLLESFIDLNSLLIERFSAEERKRIGVHSCSRRRPALDSQGGHRLCRPAAEPVPAAGRNFLPAARQRARPQACAQSDSGPFQGQATYLRRRDRSHRCPRGESRGRQGPRARSG